MRLKLLRKSSVSASSLMCLFAVLTFGQGIEAQEDPAGKKQGSSDAQKGAVPEKDASAAAEEELQKAVQNPAASLISVPLYNNTNFSLGSFNRLRKTCWLHWDMRMQSQATERRQRRSFKSGNANRKPATPRPI